MAVCKDTLGLKLSCHNVESPEIEQYIGQSTLFPGALECIIISNANLVLIFGQNMWGVPRERKMIAHI